MIAQCLNGSWKDIGILEYGYTATGCLSGRYLDGYQDVYFCEKNERTAADMERIRTKLKKWSESYKIHQMTARLFYSLYVM